MRPTIRFKPDSLLEVSVDPDNKLALRESDFATFEKWVGDYRNAVESGAADEADLELVVEETGELNWLSKAVTYEGPVHILHLSCHGMTGSGNEGVALAFEDSVGELDRVSGCDLAQKLGARQPRLLFVSACRVTRQ